MDQMGSPNLRAHGLGVPVRAAVTTMDVLEPGRHRVWVRSRFTCGVGAGWWFGWYSGEVFQDGCWVAGIRGAVCASERDPIKTALKPKSQGRKLVAGMGFEPMTFRL